MLETKVSFDKTGCKRKIHTRIEIVQKKFDAQVMKDDNYFIPKDQGGLEKSVLGSILGSGLLIWAINYAKKMYHFGGRLSKDPNPNASVKWHERSKSVNRDKWEAFVNDEYSK